MVQKPVKSGPELMEEIDRTLSVTPALWWLGHAGFVVRFANITFYIDPCLSDPPGRTRRIAAPLAAADIKNADMVFATHGHPGHLDAASVGTILETCRGAKLALPKSAADSANTAGIPYNRMTTTDSGLRIEYFKDNLYARVYAVPSAHPQLDWTATGGYPYLGYLIRFGRWTIYHAGDCRMYPELAAHLRPFNVNVALLPIGPQNFSVSEAAQLAADIEARWVIPMHYGTFLEAARTTEPGGPVRAEEDREADFVTHMLGHRPAQKFKVLKCAERWTVPEE
jgi:L-ascorbate metabolism protein UlaG (beta-lactamase superfamily)